VVALNLALQVACLVLIGAFIRKKNIVEESFETNLSRFIMNVALPAMIINSIGKGITPENIGSLWLIWGVSIVFCLAFMLLLGHLLFLALGRGHLARVARMAAFIPNFTFMGIPVISSLYGNAGLVWFNLLVVPVRLTYYLLAKPLLDPTGGREKTTVKEKIKNIFSPLVVSVIIGLILGISGLHLPVFIDKTISTLASTCNALGMVMCGMILSRVSLKDLATQPKVFIITAVRVIVLPAIALAVMIFVPIDPLLKKVVIMYCALPAAAMIPSFVVRYDNVPEARTAASVTVFTSTLLCVATLPLWYTVVEAVIK